MVPQVAAKDGRKPKVIAGGDGHAAIQAGAFRAPDLTQVKADRAALMRIG